QGLAGAPDRIPAAHRRRARLPPARRRRDRGDADRLDRVRAFGAGADPASQGAGVRARAAQSARALGASRERERFQRDRDQPGARGRRARAFRRLRAHRPAGGRPAHPEALGRRDPLRPPARLQLLHDAAREAALEQRGGEFERRLDAMLRALAVRDFVIVEKVELEAGTGFTVLSGETGAGKSILIDALELLVGGRGDASLVREGAERAELSAEFDFGEKSPLPGWLEKSDLQGDPHQVLVRRTIDRNGRSRCFINGHAATLAQLKEAGEFLLDIHGQHEHQSLLRAAAQRELLDAHAGAQEEAAACAQAWRAWQRLEALAAEAEQQFARREAERAELADKVSELKKLGPKAGEWETLSEEQKRLANGSSLLAGAQSALEALSEADGACLPQLSAIASRVRALSVHDARLGSIVEMLA